MSGIKGRLHHRPVRWPHFRHQHVCSRRNRDRSRLPLYHPRSGCCSRHPRCARRPAARHRPRKTAKSSSFSATPRLLLSVPAVTSWLIPTLTIPITSVSSRSSRSMTFVTSSTTAVTTPWIPCNKISKFMMKSGYDCRVMGIPKTIDNDLFGTDHCPGYASASKYIATSCMEIYQDARVYDTGMVCVVEIMGRHAGWLTAAAGLATAQGAGPDLIYLPETDFDMDKFMADVKKVYAEKGNCLVAVSEGIHYADGTFVSRLRPPQPTVSVMLSWAAWLLCWLTRSRASWALRFVASSCPCCSAALLTALPRPTLTSPTCR